MITPLPSVETLMEVCEATWPPAKRELKGAWTVRDGAGGGKRASATTENFPTTEADLKQAEAAMRDLGQPLLFQIRPGDEALDKMLGAHGYDIIDPVNIWAVAVDKITRAHADRDDTLGGRELLMGLAHETQNAHSQVQVEDSGGAGSTQARVARHG